MSPLVPWQNLAGAPPRAARARLGAVAAVLLLASFAAGCGAPRGRGEQRRIFTLAPQGPETVFTEVRPTIRVEDLDCARAYNQPNIVFRVSPVETRAYRHRLWASKPGVMIAEVVRRYLAASGRFTLVEGGELPAVELGGRVDLIEQASEGAVYQGRLEMSLFLRDLRTGRIVWRYRIDGAQDGERREVADVVAAQGRTLSQGLAEALPSLAEAAAEASAGSRPGPAP